MLLIITVCSINRSVHVVSHNEMRLGYSKITEIKIPDDKLMTNYNTLNSGKYTIQTGTSVLQVQSSLKLTYFGYFIVSYNTSALVN